MKNTERMPSAAPRGNDRCDEEALRCPRCDSPHTKFCYYNNYSRSQPRHFCKACKRYWTRGGTLRNVPVGGGFRKRNRAARQPTATGSAPPIANQIDSSSSSLDWSGEIHTLGFLSVRFDHAVGLPHLRQLNSEQGFSGDDYGSLGYFDNSSAGAYQWQHARADDSSFMEAGATETTMLQDDLFWPPCQPQSTHHAFILDNSSSSIGRFDGVEN